MKRSALLSATLSFFLLGFQAMGMPIKTIEIDDGKIVKINAALGYSTILEFNSKPVSAVLGDQDAFKLEFYKNNITIKPLIPHAKTNLFVFTEFDRFNCTILTGQPGDVDYIVRIKRKTQGPPTVVADQNRGAEIKVKTKQINKVSSYLGFTLRVISVSYFQAQENSRGVTVVDFELSSRSKSYRFSPATLGVRQKNEYLNIESLSIDSFELRAKGVPVHGKIAVLNKDLRDVGPIEIIFAIPIQSKRSTKGVYRLSVVVGKSTAVKKQEKGGIDGSIRKNL